MKADRPKRWTMGVDKRDRKIRHTLEALRDRKRRKIAMPAEEIEDCDADRA